MKLWNDDCDSDDNNTMQKRKFLFMKPQCTWRNYQ